MKRTAISLSLVVISMSMIIGACGSKPNGSGAGAPTASANINPTGYPIAKEKVNLKVFTKQEPYVEDYATNDFTKWYEDKTNVHVNWDVVPSSGSKEKLQVKLAGGDLPDVFMSAGLSDSQIVGYGSQGLLIPLNQLIDKYAPNIKKMIEKAPYLKDYLYAPDGNIYSLQNTGETYHATMPKKMWVYKPWLDKLNLKVPTTTEEFYNMLKAFKTQDPNGNGKPDEVPLSGADGTTASNNEPESFIMQSFIYYDRTNYLMIDNGNVEFAADKQGYKDGLKYMRKLVQDGLLQPDAFIQDRKALTALAEDPSAPRLGAAASLYWGNFTIDNGPSGRYKDYVAIPVLAGPDGKRFGFDRGYSPSNGVFSISKNAKDPVAAIRWIDWFFNEDNKLQEGWSDYLGKEGVGWKKPAAGTQGLDGRPATYDFIIPFGTKTNTRWSQTAPRYQDENFRMSIANTPDNQLEAKLYNITKDLYKPYGTPKMQVPHMYFSDEDLTKSGDLQKNIQTVVQDFQLKFVTGSLDIDKDWDKYTKELNNAGLQDFLKIMRAGYAKINK